MSLRHDKAIIDGGLQVNQAFKIDATETNLELLATFKASASASGTNNYAYNNYMWGSDRAGYFMWHKDYLKIHADQAQDIYLSGGKVGIQGDLQVDNNLIIGSNTRMTENGWNPYISIDSNSNKNAAYFKQNNGLTVMGMQSGGTTNSQNFIVFYNEDGTAIGKIETGNGKNGEGVLYTSSSDRRLKENIADADDAGELIDAIQVRQFNWIANGEHQRYGFVAQELNAVAPEAVAEGATEDDIMGVDYSKLVPMLVKEIQSLRARVAQLESN